MDAVPVGELAPTMGGRYYLREEHRRARGRRGLRFRLQANLAHQGPAPPCKPAGSAGLFAFMAGGLAGRAEARVAWAFLKTYHRQALPKRARRP